MLGDCFDQFCCGDGRCDHVCPYKPGDFRQRMEEIGGFGVDDIGELVQRSLKLPAYLPMVHHAYRRANPLNSPAVALDPYDVFRLRQDEYRSAATNGAELRQQFKIDGKATVLFQGTCQDDMLERYWSYRRSDQVAKTVAQLDVSAVIGPNFSTFLDVPRTDVLFNQKRQVLCLSELSIFAVSVVPHLSAVMPQDWDFWARFLRRQPQLNYVAINFQTGNKSAVEGMKALDQAMRIQRFIGRPLSLILIGGAQFLYEAGRRFDSVTLVDSAPFFKAMHRRWFRPTGLLRRWQDTYTLETQPVDHVLQHNTAEYSRWASEVLAAAKSLPSLN
jgi:hypothetical protein